MNPFVAIFREAVLQALRVFRRARPRDVARAADRVIRAAERARRAAR